MKREYKLIFAGVPKAIRKQLVQPTAPRAVMDHEVKRPGSVFIDGKLVRYEGP